MAIFSKIETNETQIFRYAKCYFVDGELTMEDIAKINSSNEKTVLILPNTKSQNPSVIGYLNPTKVMFSVLGGIDYLKSPKYSDVKYIERTLFNPKQLSSIIREFQSIEKGIHSNWSELEKSVYIYDALKRTINYRREQFSGYGNGLDICWSLNGILYKNSSSFGFSMILKEMMDRNDIFCYLQTKTDENAWNVAIINGQYYGIDITKESVNKTLFNEFGSQDSNGFYGDPYREIVDQETTRFPLNTFKEGELVSIFNRMKNVPKETHMDVFKAVITKDNRRYLITHLGSIENVSYYIQGTPPKINYFYAPDGMNIANELTKDKVESLKENGYALGRVEIKKGMPRFNKFKRKDGTSFVILPEKLKVVNGVKKYHLIEAEFVGGRPMLKRTNISSENNLEEIVDPTSKDIIANQLLNQKRLGQRVEDFGGYIGYISPGSHYYFEQLSEIGENQKKQVVA